MAEIVEEYRKTKWSSWSPSTRSTWGHNTRRLLEAFGHILACDLTPARIEATYAEWMTGDDPVTPATVRRRNVALSAALIRAERLGIIGIAPTRRVQMSRAETPPATDLPDVASVLVAVDKLPAMSWLTAATRLTIATGMRRGELCALRWTDLDLDAGTVAVRGALAVDEANMIHRKGTKSKRVSALEVLDPGTVAVLENWRTESQKHATLLGVT
ncbi:MAG: tyrosine-type recombinase/integrase [Actinobacteria bacterium]|nr:tyrosine-type recombinase/integrase [Actinomycetota bacterium]